MKRLFQYTAIVIALSLAASCNLMEDVVSENGSGLILFEPQSVETKALVDNTNVTGETFAVVDLLDGAIHLQDSIKYQNNSWVYQINDKYYWDDGAHKFFGYTNKIGDLNAQWKLNIGSKTITTSSNQTDMLFSSIYTTTAEAWKTAEGHTKDTRVKLEMHHLLSAVSFSLVNSTGADMTLTSLEISLRNTGSAVVDFSGDVVDTTITVNTSVGSFGSISNKTLPAGDSLDALNGSRLSSTVKVTPYVIWPQTFDKDVATIAVSYTVGDKSYTRNVTLPAGTWTAGEINAYRLVVGPDELELIFKVLPWQKDVISLNTSNGSINMSNVTWMNSKVKRSATATDTLNSVVNSAYSVYMYKNVYVLNADSTQWVRYYYPGTSSGDSYYPAQGYFTVNYPTAGLFKIELIPAYGATTVNADAYQIYIYDSSITGTNKWRTIDPDGEDLAGWRDSNGVNTIYFQVRAASTNSTDGEKAQINIWFKPDGSTEWISAYSEVRANYALTIKN